jgi:hypothetical protein
MKNGSQSPNARTAPWQPADCVAAHGANTYFDSYPFKKLQDCFEVVVLISYIAK